MSDAIDPAMPSPEELVECPPRRRDLLVWLAPLTIVVAILAVLAWWWRRENEFAWLHVAQEQIRVPARFAAVDRVPLDPGALTGANVLLITLDTTRAGRLGAYGNAHIATPSLDRLAADGLVFTDAIAPTPTTLPTHTSIHTGLYPVHHDVRANGRFRLADGKQTLAETLKAEGYVTGAVVSAFVLDSRFGLDQGFDHYDDDVNLDGFNEELNAAERRAEVTTNLALNWLHSQPAGQPFFLWVHYFDPHANYAAPAPFRSQYSLNPYDGEIAYTDGQVGRLLDELDTGASDRTLIVVAGDHGESLAEHNEHTHGYLIYDVTLRVPLIMRCGRRLGGGAHLDQRVSLVDVAPTVLGLLGIRPSEPMDGIDLQRGAPANRLIFAETYHGWMEFGWAALLAVYSGNLKYIHGPHPEMYDLAADPTERRNLVAEQAANAQRMRAELQRVFGEEIAGDVALNPGEALDPEDLARLQALGYAFGGGEAIDDDRPRSDPKSRIELVNRIYEIQCYYTPRGMHATAVALLEDLVERYPDSYSAHYNLGSAYWGNAQLEDAVAAFRECLVLRPTAPEARHRLAQLFMAEENFEEAASELAALVEQQPADLGVQCDMAAALAGLRRFGDAALHAQIAFQLDPTSDDAVRTLVSVLPRAGRSDELRSSLRNALNADARRFNIRRELAEQFKRARRYTEAESLLREGVDVDPTAAAPRACFAWFLLQRADAARRDPRQAARLLAPLGDLANTNHVPTLLEAASAWAALEQTDRAAQLAQRARTQASRMQRSDLRAAADEILYRLGRGRHVSDPE